MDKIKNIERLRSKYGLKIPDPISENRIEHFATSFSSMFNSEIEVQYLTFLKLCDGPEEDGTRVFSSYDHEINGVLYGIFEMNKLLHEVEGNNIYIFYGDSSQDYFVFNKQIAKYQVLDRYSLDDMETFDSFSVMLEYILDQMLN